MRYEDYYRILGVERNAGVEVITRAYRRLAQRHHPDLSREPDSEEKFKAIAAAYATLRDPDKRAAYDQLAGCSAGDELQVPPAWEQKFRDARCQFEELDLADLVNLYAGGDSGEPPVRGEDHELTAHLTLEEAYAGTVVELALTASDVDALGRRRRVPRTVAVRIPKGAGEGQRLQLAGLGGKGANGGRDGDLYVRIALRPHALFRVAGHDLHLDLPVTPWEAALGGEIEVPTLGGPVHLKLPPGIRAGQKLRLARRGLPKGTGGEGDLFVNVQVVLPVVLSEQERELFQELADGSTFNPRAHLGQEIGHESRPS